MNGNKMHSKFEVFNCKVKFENFYLAEQCKGSDFD